MSPIKKTLNHPKADKEERSVFCEEMKKYEDQRRSLVFIDESGFAHDMPRLHGYSAKGSRCFGSHDWGAKGRTNVIGALLLGTLLTVSLFQTNINTLIFNAWVIEDLIPKLPPKSVVIMDNATFHKGVVMKKALENAGHKLLYLPPYSPDFNPIEKNGPMQKPKDPKPKDPKPKDPRLVEILKSCLKNIFYDQINSGWNSIRDCPH